ncbi:sensor histidine kinase [uncultured Robinsoniella sp.]|uniref:sensor histidine kinase n=1 Tax=uncultured Robinsoniella sp. TaxID=904190 RepID=UPI00374EAF13
MKITKLLFLKKRGSFAKMTMRILIPVILLLLAVLVIMFRGMQQARTLAYQYIKDTAELYVTQINRDIEQIHAEQITRMSRGLDIAQIPADIGPTDGKYYSLLLSVMEQNQILKIRYAEASNFYVYDSQSELLILDTGIYYRSSQKSEKIENLLSFLKADMDKNIAKWTYFNDGVKDYIAGLCYVDGVASGCLIPVEGIFHNLTQKTKGYQVIPFIQKPDGAIMTVKDSQKYDYDELIRKSMAKDQRELYSYKIGYSGRIYMIIHPEHGILENVIQMQMFLTIFAVLIVAGLLFGAYNYYRRILVPMRQFIDGLKRTEEEQWINENGTNNIIELEQASNEFKGLLRKIKQLKIEIYEKELERQKIELDYIQEQINPHFFLNCLSIIHGIAEEAKESRIVTITGMLSDYMRYIFRDASSKRTVSEELKHVLNYIRIQKLRYGEGAFAFEVIQDDDVSACLLPALLLQTLVENAVIHAVSLDQHIEITMYLALEEHEDGKYMYVTLSDTGKGFPAEVLKALEEGNNIVYDGRRHVGLQNAVQRLRLMYKDKAQIHFSNMDEGFGAVTEIILPVEEL